MADIKAEVQQLRNQGLSDNVVMQELMKRGNQPGQIHQAISELDSNTGGMPGAMPRAMDGAGSMMQSPLAHAMPPSQDQSNIYERIEEITESMINERWEELIGEVKKIVEWKNRVEESQHKINSDLQKIKDDFKVLHQGVLGKLEDYDTRMRDVGTELSAVGKVFKDVIPEFVQNVKELSHLKDELKK